MQLFLVLVAVWSILGFLLGVLGFRAPVLIVVSLLSIAVTRQIIVWGEMAWSYGWASIPSAPVMVGLGFVGGWAIRHYLEQRKVSD